MSDDIFKQPFLSKVQFVEFNTHPFDLTFEVHGFTRIGV